MKEQAITSMTGRDKDKNRARKSRPKTGTRFAAKSAQATGASAKTSETFPARFLDSHGAECDAKRTNPPLAQPRRQPDAARTDSDGEPAEDNVRGGSPG